MPERPLLTDIAHRAWAPFLHPGSWAIDATSGNGHDTEFLAREVSPDGHVFALDIQESAIQATSTRLKAGNLLDRVTLVREDHSRMRNVLDPCPYATGEDIPACAMSSPVAYGHGST